MIAAQAAGAAAAAGTSIAAVSFTAVLAPRPRAHRRRRLLPALRHAAPPPPPAPLGPLTTAIAAQPLARESRKRTSGRTTTERRKWPTEEATYDLIIGPSNLPKADTSPRT